MISIEHPTERAAKILSDLVAGVVDPFHIFEPARFALCIPGLREVPGDLKPDQRRNRIIVIRVRRTAENWALRGFVWINW
jgi:hypothetical protein